jgi:single-stranded DNA-binding protein
MSTEYKHLVGRVGTMPELKTTPTGKSLAEFRLAVDGPYDPATRSSESVWYDVTAWEPMDKVAKDNIVVGNRVWVAGPTSVFAAPSGDRNKVTVRELGMVDKLIPAPVFKAVTATPVSPLKAAPKKKAKVAPTAGVTFDDEDAEW